MKNKWLAFLFCFIFFSDFQSCFSDQLGRKEYKEGREPVSLVFNIISQNLKNGAGKEVDAAILKQELEQFGHRVNLFDYYEVNDITSADINIFLAQFKTKWFSKAKFNWFIPNAEFCNATVDELHTFDLILCKTGECFRIFKSLCDHTYYLGFTGLDHYQPSIHKDFSKHLHVAGKSRMKGTEQVLQAWKNHPQLPSLILITHRDISDIFSSEHVRFINKRIPERALIKMQNKCGIHLCPSQTEGFGHYMIEAMSTEAVIITTDAPPMNEFIRDQRCLVKYNQNSKKNYATMYLVDDEDLAQTVEQLQHLSYEELKMIGQHNREEYLRRKKEFKENFQQLMNRTMKKFY